MSFREAAPARKLRGFKKMALPLGSAFVQNDSYSVLIRKLMTTLGRESYELMPLVSLLMFLYRAHIW